MRFLIFMRFLMGVDGGGTSTRAVVVASESWQILGRGVAGSSNHYSVGAQGAAQNCQLAVQRALAEARLGYPEISSEAISAWGFGLAGVRRERDALLMRTHLEKRFNNAIWTLETDAVVAHNGAFMGAAGVMLSAGTGAICLGIDEKDNHFYADGWGPILGDLGSGYWIGQEALRAVCRAQDAQTGACADLRKVLLGHLELEDWDALVRWVYAPSTSRDQIAQLSQTVFAMAVEGEENAIKIQREAASHLAESVLLVVQRMRQAQKKCADVSDFPFLPIILRGGLFADTAFQSLVSRTIEERITNLKGNSSLLNWGFTQPYYDADVGAAFCAQKLLTLC